MDNTELILENRLQYHYQTGNIDDTPKDPDTGWRVLPCIMCSYANDSCTKVYIGNASPVVLPKHHILWIPAGLRHRTISSPNSANKRSYTWMHFNYFTSDGMDLFSFYTCPDIISPPYSTSIAKLISKWIIPLHGGTLEKMEQAALCNSVGFEILSIISKFCSLKPESFARLRATQRLREVLDYIHGNISARITRDELAVIANMSVPQFHRLFVEATGICPMKYVRQRKISHARQLLLYTDNSIARIAELTGYDDQFVFSKMFKRESGINPLEYRKEIKI
jgi:AraC-like DNA-binding protein